ncbi:hypothetical protein ACWDUM_01020 [Rhodococcus sp. NPDC003322]
MTALKAVMAPTEGNIVDGFREADVYDLPDALSDEIGGVYLTGDVDQEFLAEHRDLLTAFVTGGGRVLVNGHVQRVFLDGLTRWRKLDFRSPADLTLTRVSAHPVWEGIDPKSLLYNTGTPGPVPFDELERIGVAGFYGRGCYLGLPEDARVVHTIGRTAAPIDYDYPLGAGRVLVHGGNDLLQFAGAHRGTAALRTQILDWLEGL